MMRRERMVKRRAKRQRRFAEVLRLDPCDPDILGAKELLETSRPPRRRAA